MELWLDARYVRAGYSWSFPAAGKVRVGCGSFWPDRHVRRPTEQLVGDLGLAKERFHGNWIPHQIREPVEGRVCFVGDAAGHCLPVTAEGIRTAFYFGLYLGLQLARAYRGQLTVTEAIADYAAFHRRHAWIFTTLLGVQRLVGWLMPTAFVRGLVRTLAVPPISRWSFERYLRIAPPPTRPLPPHADPLLLAGALGR